MVTTPRSECLSPAVVVGIGRGSDGAWAVLWVGAAVLLQTRAPGWWCKALSPVPVCPWHGRLPGLWLLGRMWKGLWVWRGWRSLFGAEMTG